MIGYDDRHHVYLACSTNASRTHSCAAIYIRGYRAGTVRGPLLQDDKRDRERERHRERERSRRERRDREREG